jgi:hypothetical protein
VGPLRCFAASRSRRRSQPWSTTSCSRVHRDNFSVYGIEKIWRQLNREGTRVGQTHDRVARHMDELNFEGAVRGKRKRVTRWPLLSATRGQSGRVIPSRRASTELRASQSTTSPQSAWDTNRSTERSCAHL